MINSHLNELFGLGIAIMFGLFAGKIFHKIKIPKVTGYMIVGLLIGPSIVGLIPKVMITNLSVINDIALGLILFAIGNEIEWFQLKRIGLKELFSLFIIESSAVLILVTGSFLLLGFDLHFSLLAGTMAIATAPAATLLVVREYHARGPLTDRLMSLVAMNNILALILFRFVKAFTLIGRGGDTLTILVTPFYEVIVSLALGYMLGIGLKVWEDHLDELSELLLAIVCVIMIGTGLAIILGLSPMLVAIAAGATIANSSYLHKLIYTEQRQFEQPVYIAFFVLAGTSLHLELLPQMGIAGLVYLLARTVGKVGGIWLTGRLNASNRKTTKFLGMTMLCQAGVAIGIVYEVNELFPEYGHLLMIIILSTVVVNETFGPYLVKLGLHYAKEIPKKDEFVNLASVRELKKQKT
jgi:Kef-type K+ transport system membrane component KefB